MRSFLFFVFLSALYALPLVADSAVKANPGQSSEEAILRLAPSPAAINGRIQKFPEAPISMNLSNIPKPIRQMIAPLVKASNAVDKLFWEQSSPEAHKASETLLKSKNPDAQNLGRLIAMNYGPWDRFANDQALIWGKSRPLGGNFYPRDLSRSEFNSQLIQNPEQAEALQSPTSILRRQEGKLVSIPYSEHWKELSSEVSSALKDAAQSYRCTSSERQNGLCVCEDFVAFLRARARAFVNNDYNASENLWVQSKACPLDIAIGPYEFYEDRFLGQKAAFEAILTYRDDMESERVKALSELAPKLIEDLPVSESLRARLQPIPSTPITIADLLFSAGDARAGFQMRAYTLPNDESVRIESGQKHVVLRNVTKAKFDTLLKPLAERVLIKASAALVSFDAYFDFLLAWQLSHNVIVAPISLPDGSTATSQELLRDRHAVIQSLKGEAMALWNYLALVDAGIIDDVQGQKLSATYIASLFDSARQSSNSPQALARTIAFNFLSSKWVLRYHPQSKKFEVNPLAMRQAAKALVAETLEVLARGDYDGAGRLILQYGLVSEDIRQTVEELEDLPIEIRPVYSIEADIN